MDDVYIRYLSYEKQSDLELDLCTKNPFKIDIGPVMSARPKDHRIINSMQPVQRELIFDIDMTDYDDVRSCCSGAEICQKCWKFMVVACQIIDAALRGKSAHWNRFFLVELIKNIAAFNFTEDLNFEHILWVFSGRRGIHCWVCDKTARHMNPKNRNSVAEYLNVLSGSGATKVIIGERMHHSMKRAHRIIEPFFDEIILNEQNVFGSSNGRKKLLEMLPDENMRNEIETKVMAVEENNSKTVWELVKRFIQNNRSQNVRRTKYLVEEIQLSMLYPRLDIAVSKAANHLLKSPFCVHPKTGKICVPFNPSAVSKFDPTTVPTIRQLLKEIDQFDKNAENESTDATQTKRIIVSIQWARKTREERLLNEVITISLQAYRKTGMYKGVFVFEEFLRKLESAHKTKKIQTSDAKMDF